MSLVDFKIIKSKLIEKFPRDHQGFRFAIIWLEKHFQDLCIVWYSQTLPHLIALGAISDEEAIRIDNLILTPLRKKLFELEGFSDQEIDEYYQQLNGMVNKMVNKNSGWVS